MSIATPRTIGKEIKVSRVLKDLTQETLGKFVHVSRQTIMSIENEEHNPGFELAYRLSRALGFSLDNVVPNDWYAEVNL